MSVSGTAERGPSDEQLRAWSQELMSWWEHFQWSYASSRMRRPQFGLVRSRQFLGRWNRDERKLELAIEHLLRDPWRDVLETLRHEMAHQYAHEVLGARDEAPHGPAFHQACRILRADPRAQACETAATRSPLDAPLHEGEDRVRSRVAKLLSLATSPNEHEAETAMKKARELLVKHRIEQQDAVDRRTGSPFEVREIGSLRRRREYWEYQLGNLLQTSFFVSVIWVDSYDVHDRAKGRRLEICGTRFHLDMAEYVHGYLTQLLPSLWQDYRRRQEKVAGRERPRYYAGVLAGFEAQLAVLDRRLVQEEGLILSSDPALEEYHAWLYPKVRRSGGASVQLTDGYRAGFQDGKEVRLRQPLGKGKGASCVPPALESGVRRGSARPR